MPKKNSTRLKDASEFRDHAGIVTRVVEESKGREKIYHGVESTFPPSRKATHVAAGVFEIRPRPALARNLQKMLGIIETVDSIARLGQQVCMPSLSARYVEYARSYGETKYIDNARGFMTIALGGENRLILEQILGVEVRLPPLAFPQKNTGSRYAPKTSSIAARIS